MLPFVKQARHHICRQRYSYQILVILEPILRGVETTERLSFLIFSHKNKGDLNFSMIKGGAGWWKKNNNRNPVLAPLPPPLGGWGVGGLGGLLNRTANQFKRSDFPTPRGYEQAVHPPFNSSGIVLKMGIPELGRKVRQTLPTLLFVDPAGGKVKKRALLLRHICR